MSIVSGNRMQDRNEEETRWITGQAKGETKGGRKEGNLLNADAKWNGN